MAVVGEIPGLELEVVAFALACLGLYLLQFLACRLHVGVQQLVQQVVDVGGALCHALLEHEVGIGLVAQQLSALLPQVDYAMHDLLVVLLVGLDADGILGHVHLAAQLAVVGVGDEGSVAGSVEGEQPSFLAVFAGSECSGLARGFGQSCDVGLVGQVELVGVGFLQVVLRELQGQQRHLVVDFAQSGLVFLVECSARADKAFVGLLQQRLLLGSQRPWGALAVGCLASAVFHGIRRGLSALPVLFFSGVIQVVDSLHALEVAFLEEHVVGVLREDGSHLLRQCFHLVVRLGREQVVEDLGHSLQQVVRRGHGDGVVERRRLWVVHDLLDESFVLTDAFEHGGFVVLELYLVEGRRLVGRLIVLGKEWIVSHSLNDRFKFFLCSSGGAYS